MIVFGGSGGGLVVGCGAFLVGGGSVCEDMGGFSTGDEVLLTSPSELVHCGGMGGRSFFSLFCCLFSEKVFKKGPIGAN